MILFTWIAQIVCTIGLFIVCRKVQSDISNYLNYSNTIFDTLFSAHPEVRQTFAAAREEAREKFPI